MNTSCTIAGCAVVDGRLMTAITETAKDAMIDRQAMPPDTDLESRRPSAAFTRYPRNGSRGISASMERRSPLQRCKGVRAERLPMAEERDHDRQADRRFSGSHGH